MKHDMIKHLVKSFKASTDFIYLAGPFFNELQVSWAKLMASTLRERNYKVYAPVDFIYEEGKSLDAEEIFNRNIKWMENSKLVLAQIDYLGSDIILPDGGCIELPDTGSVFEMGYCFARQIPVIGYSISPTVSLNLMLGKSMAGFIDGSPLNIFKSHGMEWNEIMEWKGKNV